MQCKHGVVFNNRCGAFMYAASKPPPHAYNYFTEASFSRMGCFFHGRKHYRTPVVAGKHKFPEEVFHGVNIFFHGVEHKISDGRCQISWGRFFTREETSVTPLVTAAPQLGIRYAAAAAKLPK